MKKCIGCGETLPLERFYKNKTSGYYQSRCKPCNIQQVREYRKTVSPEKRREWVRRHRAKHHNTPRKKAQQILEGMKARSKRKGFVPPEWTREEIEQAVQGSCAKTGIPFEFDQGQFSKSPWTPVPDRIDSTQGYTHENVQWVCHMFNSLKQEYTEREVNRFLVAIADSTPGDF